jgi:hypothetical protein
MDTAITAQQKGALGEGSHGERQYPTRHRDVYRRYREFGLLL